MKVPFYKRLLSFFYPVPVVNRYSAHNPVLEIYLYRNRWQLATLEALYSDGHRYLPLRKAFGSLRKMLPEMHNVLVLGTGLGSAVHILHRMHLQPHFTLVDIDEIVLQLARELMPPAVIPHIDMVCADAALFVKEHKSRYDIVVIDIFNGRHAPAFVTSAAFLESCHALLSDKGYLVMNYIPENDKQGAAFKEDLLQLFSRVRIRSFGLNMVVIVSR